MPEPTWLDEARDVTDEPDWTADAVEVKEPVIKGPPTAAMRARSGLPVFEGERDPSLPREELAEDFAARDRVEGGMARGRVLELGTSEISVDPRTGDSEFRMAAPEDAREAVLYETAADVRARTPGISTAADDTVSLRDYSPFRAGASIAEEQSMPGLASAMRYVEGLQPDVRYSPGAMAQGASEMLTFGHTDEIAGAIGDRPYEEGRDLAREQMAERAAENPGSTLAGMGAGMGLLAALPGAREVAASRGAGALGRVGAAMGEGTVMGALAGAGTSEGDVGTRQFAEDTATGGVIGGSAAGALGLGAEGAVVAARGLRSGLMDAASRAASARARVVGGEDAASIARRATQPSEGPYRAPAETQGASAAAPAAEPPLAGPAFREAARRGEEMTDQRARELAAMLSRMEQIDDAVTNYARVGLKPQIVNRLMQETPPSQGVNVAVTDAMETVRGRIDDIQGFREGFQPATLNQARRISQHMDAIARRMEEMAGRADPEARGEIFGMLDQLKRSIGQAQRVRDRGGQEVFRAAYEDLRRMLEDPRTWGEGAARMQREINAAWAPWLAQSGGFRRTFMTDVGGLRGADPFDTLLEGDPGRISTFARNITDPAQDIPRRLLQEGLPNRARLMRSLVQHYDAPDDLQRIATESEDVSQRAIALARELERDATAAAELRSVRDVGTSRLFPNPATLSRIARRFDAQPERMTSEATAPVSAGPGRIQRIVEQQGRAFFSLGEFGPILQNALSRGPGAFGATWFVLSQQHPELQERVQELDDPEAAETAEEY